MVIALLRDASSEIRKAAEAGKCWFEAEKEINLEKYASWPGFKNNLRFVVQRYCALWGRGF